MNLSGWIHICIFTLLSNIAFGQLEVLVTNENQTGLPYVEVYTSDFEFSTLSDEEGKVIIPHKVKTNQTIIFNFLGYQQQSYKKSELIANPLIILKHGLIMDEVLMVGRTDNQSRDLPGKIESINTKVFKLTNPQTAADALDQHADVYVQKSQMGGGSPVVRGFEANKVLLVLDGIRMNNAIYRSGHLQSAITVDNAMLERLEVLYGPGSLIYGSDAIGGVVHFRSKNPRLNFDEQKRYNAYGNAYARYATANKEKSAHIDFNIGNDKFGSLTSLTFSDYSDLRTGSKRGDDFPDFGKRLNYVERENNQDIVRTNPDPNIQIGTAYQQVDMLQKILYQPNDQIRIIANFQFSTSSDIPRYDALTETQGNQLSFAEWYYGPQNRFLSSLRSDLNLQSALYDKIILIAAYQKIDEDRIDRRFGSNNLDRQEEDVNVYSITADLHKYLDKDGLFEINYGLEFNKNDLVSTAFRTNISNGSITDDILTRYPSGGGSTNNAAFYALMKKSFPKIDLFAGFRFSSNGLKVKYNRTDNLPWPENYYDGISTNNKALSWSLGTAYSPVNGLKISGQLSTAFRSPNIDDLAKIRVNASEISVPNINLQPEKSLNGELTISQKINSYLFISATGFMTSLQDAIVRADFTLPDGTSFLVDEGDTLKTVSNINANSARVKGVSLNIKSVLSQNIELSGSINYIRGRQFDASDDQTPLSHIPPLYGKVSMAYVDDHQQISLRLRYNGEKPVSEYGGSEDNLINATAKGTPAWYTLNAYYLRKINNSISVSFALENIMDTHYRPFASGVSAPGRNIILSLNSKF
jgi:hemoglobin/transferrin/lactoferrin receptor protein